MCPLTLLQGRLDDGADHLGDGLPLPIGHNFRLYWRLPRLRGGGPPGEPVGHRVVHPQSLGDTAQDLGGQCAAGTSPPTKIVMLLLLG